MEVGFDWYQQKPDICPKLLIPNGTIAQRSFLVQVDDK
jgi:hypothetical protein